MFRLDILFESTPFKMVAQASQRLKPVHFKYKVRNALYTKK